MKKTLSPGVNVAGGGILDIGNEYRNWRQNRYGDPNVWNDVLLGSSSDKIYDQGCKDVSAAKIISTIAGKKITPAMIAPYADSNGDLSQEQVAKAANLYLDDPTKNVMPDYFELTLNAKTLASLDSSLDPVFVIAKVMIGGGFGKHYVNVESFGVNDDGSIVYGVSGASVNDDAGSDDPTKPNPYNPERQFTSEEPGASSRHAQVVRIETYTVKTISHPPNETNSSMFYDH